MKRLLAVFLLISCAVFAIDRQPNADYRARREALAKKSNGAPILVFAAMETDAASTTSGFRQDENFWYLTGINEPGAAVLIAPPFDPSALPPNMQAGARAAGITLEPHGYTEVLLLPQHNRLQERWTGKKLGPDDADLKQETGFDRVAALDKLPDELRLLLPPLGAAILTNQENASSKLAFEWLKHTNVAASPREVQPLMASLRQVKDAGEIALIRKATDASVAAHLAAMHAMKSATNERQIAALMQYEFERRGCERPAYAPIVGAGINSTVLHYSADSNPINSGDVVVLDVGGEYSGYATDITRTLPANGHFTARQREIYEIVWGAQKAAIDAFQAGKSVIGGARDNPDSLQRVAMEYINSHGTDLHGQPLGQYFIHGLGHQVGLNVHDPAEPGRALDKGMVFTIEPGIYIPEEKLGVRIEDTFLVDENGKLVKLSGEIPSRAEDVEKMMAAK